MVKYQRRECGRGQVMPGPEPSNSSTPFLGTVGIQVQLPGNTIHLGENIVANFIIIHKTVNDCMQLYFRRTNIYCSKHNLHNSIIYNFNLIFIYTVYTGPALLILFS